MSSQLELIRELQQSELKRLQSVAEIDATESRNPLGLRCSNIDHAFNIVVAAKFVGFPVGFEFASFQTLVGEILHDYLVGDYITRLPDYQQTGIRDSRQSEDWFDFAQNVFFLSLFLGDSEVTTLLSNWIQFDMMPDSGSEDVSAATNYLYELVAAIWRGESLPADFAEILKSRTKRKYDHLISAMLIALNSSDQASFVESANAFDKLWPGNRKHAILHEIVSVEASVLCMLWRVFHEGGLDELAECQSLYFQPLFSSGELGS